jgi:hypothetical protein
LPFHPEFRQSSVWKSYEINKVASSDTHCVARVFYAWDCSKFDFLHAKAKSKSIAIVDMRAIVVVVVYVFAFLDRRSNAKSPEN